MSPRQALSAHPAGRTRGSAAGLNARAGASRWRFGCWSPQTSAGVYYFHWCWHRRSGAPGLYRCWSGGVVQLDAALASGGGGQRAAAPALRCRGRSRRRTCSCRLRRAVRWSEPTIARRGAAAGANVQSRCLEDGDDRRLAQLAGATARAMSPRRASRAKAGTSTRLRHTAARCRGAGLPTTFRGPTSWSRRSAGWSATTRRVRADPAGVRQRVEQRGGAPAWAQQALFFGPIGTRKDHLGAISARARTSSPSPRAGRRRRIFPEGR